MVIFTKDYTKMTSLAVLVNITGRIKATLKDTSKMDLDVAKDYGKEALETAISMKANIRMIKNGDTAFLHGKTVTYTKEIILAI